MKVFLSWSGEKSREIAELLDSWIRCVLQAVDPWISTKHIDRGSVWFTEIADQLQNTTIGIICLTRDNLNKPWILFEAGALARGLSASRVCTFLVDVLPTDIENPLAQFNHTLPNKESMKSLIYTLNNSLKENKLREDILNEVFETYWPKFDEKIALILLEHPEKVQNSHIRSEENILLEVLETTRSFDKRIRNIEMSVNHRPEIPASFARKRILEMLNMGMSEDMVIEELTMKNVPLNFIKKYIMSYKNDEIIDKD